MRCSIAQNFASKCSGRTATYRTFIGSRDFFQLQLLYGNQQRAVRKQKEQSFAPVLPPFALDLQNRPYFTGHPSCSVYHIFLSFLFITIYFVHICTNKSDNPVLNYFKSKHSSMFMAGIFDHSNGKAPKKLSKINQSVHVPITYFLLVGIRVA